jgi:hypothetical protein
VVNLWRGGQGRRILALLAINAVPVLAFASFWQGKEIERYLPLFPWLVAALAYSLCHDRAIPLLKYVVLAFVVGAVVTNVGVMAKPAQARQQAAVHERLNDLVPLLKPSSKLALVQDQLGFFFRDFPFDPLNNKLHTYVVVALGLVDTPQWRQAFAGETLSVWQSGGDVWITKRVFSPRPRPEWNWAEGDDPRVSWTDVYKFCSQLEVGQSVGGDDGFVLVLPSPANRQLLGGFAQEKSQP